MKSYRMPLGRSRFRGFTMVELLMVVAIIGVLVGLLVPAITGALRTSRIASVRAEISQLETAIGKFRAIYNMDPPSNITLWEDPSTSSGWTSSSPSAAALKSQALIRQIWPQFNFAATRDLNGDGDTTDGSVTLTAGECLVFFLGGVNSTNIANNIGSCTGFSKNPADPLVRGGTREAVLFEFLPNRFTDLNGNGFPEYKDPLPNQKKPYLYYSGYDGAGYDAFEFISRSTAEPGRMGLSEPYRTGTALATALWKPNGYQIISPGYDSNYGYGGAYVPTGSDRLPFVASVYTGASPALVAPTADMRQAEEDNITNFVASGVLNP